MKQLGDVTKINGAEIEPVDVITFGAPCFVAGTKVITDVGYKNIEDVKVGDMVLTHMNRFRPVLRVGFDKNKQTYEIVAQENERYKVKGTGNHPFYIITENEGKLSEPYWKELQHLQIKDYLIVPQKAFLHLEGTIRIPKQFKEKEENILLLGFKSRIISEVTTVYNLEVEEDNSYTANNAVVHNCQDISVAGQRKGMKHEDKGDNKTTRSGLFFDVMRIVQEMREATNKEYPKFSVYENVVGLYSSNKGEDFYEVLKEHIKLKDPTIHVPRPNTDKTGKLIWRKSGEILGDGFSIAWRTHDAQHWGVAQRRRRVSIIMDFRGHSASEILFKQESLRGYNSESGLSWERASTDFKASTGISDSELRLDNATGDRDVGNPQMLKIRSGCEGGGKGALVQNNLSAPYALDAYNQTINSDTTMSITSAATDPHHIPCMIQPIALQANSVDRADTAGCNGKGWNEETMYTLTTMDRHCVMSPHVYENHANDSRVTECMTACTALTSRMGTGGGNAPFVGQAYVLNERQYALTVGTDVANTLTSTDYKGTQCLFQPIACDRASFNQGANAQYNPQFYDDGTAPTQVAKGPCAVCTRNGIFYLVRRITPKEAARLQGFPDNHADIGDWIDGKRKLRKGSQSDSHQYKAYGNSIALPFWKWLFLNMRDYLPENATHGSLFSGIGGFDLVFNSIYPNGSKWCSEIEEFPIAVLERRFGKV